MNNKNLIVNADDFGMSTEITDGIIQSHIKGIVTSTSLMANMPDAPRAVTIDKDLPELTTGIHLNITEGAPILPPNEVQSLVDSTGNFLERDEMITKLKKWQVRPNEIAAEFSAQIARMMDM